MRKANPSDAGRPEPRCKGMAIRSTDACFLELKGAAVHARAHEQMPEDLRLAFSGKSLVVGGWYPMRWFREAYGAYRSVASQGPEFARKLGYLSMKHDMQRIHNRVIAMFSFSVRLYSSYFNTGKFEVIDSRTGYMKARMEGCMGFDQNIFADVTGSTIALLECAPAKEVRVHVVSGGRDGDEHMEMEGFWV
jgi:hypothetical protein